MEKNNTLNEQINNLAPWFHNIHLPDGSQTCPDHFLGDFPDFKWQKIKHALPEDLTGWKVLDIGCNAGFYTVELAKRGAVVLAIDVDVHYLKQAHWVASQFGLEDRITFRHMQVYDLANLQEDFDLIWFMGVFYHLRYPMLALDIIAQRAKSMLLFQTLAIPGKETCDVPADIPLQGREIMKDAAYPSMAFIEKRFMGDPTNWWVPNHQGILSMLRSCGFRVADMPEDETYLCYKDPGLHTDYNTWNYSEFLSATGQPWEAVVHHKIDK